MERLQKLGTLTNGNGLVDASVKVIQLLKVPFLYKMPFLLVMLGKVQMVRLP